jgi:HD-GYP domain-containing protein (c-di-GMP phosphodiesterase class II)
MFVKDGIYDANSVKLLAKGGTYLNERLIEAIKKLNENRDTIYVSPAVYGELKKLEVPVEIISRDALEKSTGYSAALDKTINLLNEITEGKGIRTKAINEIATDLSESSGINSPSIITSLINALGPIDEYLQRHCINVGLLNGIFSQWLGSPSEVVNKLVLVGLLHDCGKALMPSMILNAPRKLTITEYEVIKTHAKVSYDLTMDFADSVREAAYSHHERMDGKGYPRHLKGEDLSLASRITAITDIYDAIVSQRLYKTPHSPFDALARISELRGDGLDSGLVDIFIEHMVPTFQNKPVLMSDGSIAIVRSFDIEDVEYPTVESNNEFVKTDENYYCVGLHLRD